ncbi:nitric oxide reductase large subunit-like protein [Galbibacter marinus]|uniref:Nitric oxide reductase large subunit-like protein n=1 Tax=Galbibacter marinus TaxID=555500 RepID=K2QIV4_9FLAO|nr:nitric oxide reductase large subunit-like protein [Galbibacter marinus]
MWDARLTEFAQQPGMDTIKWLRVTGDTTFAIGFFALIWFVFSLKSGREAEKELKIKSYGYLHKNNGVPQKTQRRNKGQCTRRFMCSMLGISGI